jgi:hypothetical protein
VVEGRSRESIWRDGRWWDELAMSVLESDWRARRDGAVTVPSTEVGVDEAAPVEVGAAERSRRTFGRWR